MAAGAGPETNSPGAELFRDNCTACHVDISTFSGVYGTEQTALEEVIRTGGNNIMSMPAFGDRLSEEEITTLAAHLRSVMGWE